MPINSSAIRNSFNEILKYGVPVRIRYYTDSFPTGSYDDQTALTESGTAVWHSGLLQPVANATRGTEIAVLVEQGKILQTDHILYLPGSLALSGTIKIGIGSPPSYENTIVGEGITQWNINGSAIYSKCFIRRLTNGSLYGEA